MSEDQRRSVLRRALYADGLLGDKWRLWVSFNHRLIDANVSVSHADPQPLEHVTDKTLRGLLGAVLVEGGCELIELQLGTEEGQPRTKVAFSLAQDVTPVTILNAVLRRVGEVEWDEQAGFDEQLLYEELAKSLNRLLVPRQRPRPVRKPSPRRG